MFNLPLFAQPQYVPTLFPASTLIHATVTGPMRGIEPVQTIIPATTYFRTRVPGPISPPLPHTLRSVNPAPTYIRTRVPGTRNVPLPYIVGSGETQHGIRLSEVSIKDNAALVKNATISLVENGNHTGSFEIIGIGPSAGAEVQLSVGSLTLKGYVSEADYAIVSDDVEAATTKVNMIGYLRDWEQAVVGTDLSGRNVHRLGPPAQSIRHFDWVMDRATTADAWSQTPVTRDVVAAALDPDRLNRIGIPDNWPETRADWMWSSRPGLAGAGWACFRTNFDVWADQDEPRKIAFWMCAYDYAELWVDGVQLMTCDTAGVAQHVIQELSGDHHLISIRGHNGGGIAGILFAPMIMQGNRVYNSIAHSGSGGWQCAAEKLPAALSIPQVMEHVLVEARERHALVGRWSAYFGGGVATPSEPITLDVGMTYKDVLDRFADGFIDYYLDPTSGNVKCVPKGYTGANQPAPWGTGSTTLSKSVGTVLW